ncbi:hypothetical protein [Afipia sp. GAS231]|uniref:hypothetical protein n=1 Tax=Afipia sp. GAS231 TaxID=1882747 RepID=UPI00087DA461|nr:hypothetical protein [Afipia sp. GAS231]SDP20452.1 hypothetical protein SAMN05444050_6130 [Afipia sp. GAS231]
MTIGVLVAGIGLVLAGLLAIGLGIPVKEFSFGNTLILIGAMGVCSGAIMIALWMAVRELKNIARRLGAGLPEPRGEITVRPVLPPGAVREAAPGEGGMLFSRDEPAAASAEPPPPPPWQDEAARDRPPALAPEPEPAEPPAPKAKRNLLFSSTSRKERERAQARTSEPLPPDMLSADIRPNPADAAPPIEPAEPPPASFDDAWPKPDRGRQGDIPPQRRSARPPPAPEANGAPAQSGDQPAVTVLKSGVVDGMAYSLYSDGSIEAQMPEGMMRFASIDELRAHLDHRP